MKTLEEVTYEAGRDALADQEALVAGIRQRTGTLLAAHALVASFLGATTIRAVGLHPLGWLAAAGFGYQALRRETAPRVTIMSRCSGLLSVLMIAQTLAWLSALAVD